ncbi:electron transport complex subunit RsxE [Neofamilia massiliensis]|uniref:electron transport complex subunit RsxE n=1 Tax=Neofamilia massiliensis TaxID=1673724 RepID=UPI0006BB5F3D|nr:electron transport complex subunit E [Neofamilia massiliensis]
MNLWKVFKDGIFKNNPILIQLIGLCSVLAVTTSVINSLSMGVAVTFVAAMSNMVVSAIRKITPNKIRIPIFIVVIATFVTVVQMVLNAYAIDIYNSLGIFLPLIVVNCLILGRAEGFAYKNKVIPSLIDGLGAGVGYTLAVLVMGVIRELFGSGTLFGMPILPDAIPKIGVLVAPAGAFITLGYFIALFKHLVNKKMA